MKIQLPFNNNILPEYFGKEADSQDILQENPVRSFPFEILNIPDGTECLAFTLIDYDAVPVCSFPWIHWLVTDVSVEGITKTIPENFSIDYKREIIQGKNSFSSFLLQGDFSEIETLFVGPTPPDTDHRYTLKVFALSEKTNLQNGFFYNELMDAMKGRILDTVEIEIIGLY
ncbi:YbhB/YbcL family Raf kinase inhibitor-like protein [Streptococcus marmotae]|uniref:YbhB/YbcL family Raf kinase inhibitor-like protein n=1 Tax=Streptococcus marmotae TaxID=1825069 RepID=UPI00082A28F0|nr:YbhB/YbcL family Raf kinase inhibitor-like protein [Streptococcus marmotae]